jgi:DivIVA domain-containing protein
MALDRQSIEKKDFPTRDHGYDTAAVDAHLSAIADEVEGLKRSSRQQTGSLAAAASERVSAIVDAAEASASEIQRQAEDDAREIRADADRDAAATRDRAGAQAREYVGNVKQSLSSMIERLEAMNEELGSLPQSTPAGPGAPAAPRLHAAEVQVPPPAPEVAPPAGVAPPAARVAQPVEVAPPPAEATVADGGDDTEGARLVALNMALNGTPREETDRYLAENFKLIDRRGLLDEVYESVEG